MKKLITLILIFACVFCLAGCLTKGQTEKALMENGPWAKDAIWVDDDSQIYLICSKNSEDIFAKVTAFLFVNDQWQAYSLDLYQGAPIVSFCTSDGERVLEAKAKMDGQMLRLYDFKVYNSSLGQSYSDRTLSRFSRQEQIDKLPFDIA